MSIDVFAISRNFEACVHPQTLLFLFSILRFVQLESLFHISLQASTDLMFPGTHGTLRGTLIYLNLKRAPKMLCCMLIVAYFNQCLNLNFFCLILIHFIGCIPSDFLFFFSLFQSNYVDKKGLFAFISVILCHLLITQTDSDILN